MMDRRLSRHWIDGSVPETPKTRRNAPEGVDEDRTIVGKRGCREVDAYERVSGTAVFPTRRRACQNMLLRRHPALSSRPRAKS